MSCPHGHWHHWCGDCLDKAATTRPMIGRDKAIDLIDLPGYGWRTPSTGDEQQYRARQRRLAVLACMTAGRDPAERRAFCDALGLNPEEGRR